MSQPAVSVVQPERRCWCGKPLGPRENQCECCRAYPPCVHRQAPPRPFVGDPLADAAKSITAKPTHAPDESRPDTLVIPWSALVSDNDRSGPRTNKGVIIGIGTTREYRKAKQELHLAALAWWQGRPMLAGPVFVHGRAFVPDDRERDTGNMRKLCLDMLEGVCYRRDAQVHDERWTRVGIDREQPRLELTVRAL